MTKSLDPEIPEIPENAALQDDPMQDSEVEQLAETSEDEYERPVEDGADEVSIDDALETDRVAAEGAESRNADGYGFDADRERGADDTVAAEQGNRDEDRMESDLEDEELDQIAGSDGDAAGTDRDLADPEV
ncbi:hypothetical protein ACTXKH_14915 [Brachybacterium tyrofermentans]|uniref:hypothetical protein n=1 Tax=Brachybacterium tyrofermentans TaxID=47848 RepID=UPI003F93BF98